MVVADLDGHRPRDPVRAQQQHVQRVVALPRQPLLGVVRRPDVERATAPRPRGGPSRSRTRRPRPRRGCARGPAGGCRRPASARAPAARPRPTRPPRARGAARAGGTRAPGHGAGDRRSDRGRTGRARPRSACWARGCPPLRRVTSCSPSASARTVTAHSLKAIGIGELERGWIGTTRYCPVSVTGRNTRADETSHTMHKVPKTHNFPANTALSSNRTDSGKTVPPGFPVRVRRGCRRGPRRPRARRRSPARRGRARRRRCRAPGRAPRTGTGRRSRAPRRGTGRRP